MSLKFSLFFVIFFNLLYEEITFCFLMRFEYLWGHLDT
jgi:hypothetical protein